VLAACIIRALYVCKHISNHERLWNISVYICLGVNWGSYEIFLLTANNLQEWYTVVEWSGKYDVLCCNNLTFCGFTLFYLLKTFVCPNFIKDERKFKWQQWLAPFLCGHISQWKSSLMGTVLIYVSPYDSLLWPLLTLLQNLVARFYTSLLTY
jgi:hypothetical protein